jgi:predicted nucleotidyltransferase
MAQRATLTTIEKTLKKYAQLLKDVGLNVERLLVYGSFAKGVPQEHSDIDICVVSPELGKDETSEMVRLNTLAHRVDPRIEVVPYSPADLAVEEDPLAHEIRKYGREIKI